MVFEEMVTAHRIPVGISAGISAGRLIASTRAALLVLLLVALGCSKPPAEESAGPAVLPEADTAAVADPTVDMPSATGAAGTNGSPEAAMPDGPTAEPPAAVALPVAEPGADDRSPAAMEASAVPASDGDETAPTSGNETTEATDKPADKPIDETDPAAKPADMPAWARNRDVWDVYTIQGNRVGHGHTQVKRVEKDGRGLLQIDALTHLSVKRFGQTTSQEMRFTSQETPEGQMLGFTSEMQMGPVPVRSSGRVEGDELLVETSTLGKTLSRKIPWSKDYRGGYATEQSLLEKPMKPGERRTIKALLFGFDQVATVELVAKDYESVELLSGTFKLLRIESSTKLPTMDLSKSTVWMDSAGETLKSHTNMLDLISYRASKEQAMAKTDLAELDFGWDVSIKVDKAIPHAHDTRKVRYRIHLDNDDPSGTLLTGPSQSLKPLDDHTAELTVYAVRPDQPGNPQAPAEEPTEADRTPSNLVQSDDAKVVALAKQAAGDERDPWKLAVKLERFVNQLIEKKDFSRAFATAAEVAANPVGDCTEHAVLLAALCRARGIPARVAVGLVYLPGEQIFGYHMWTEVFIDKQWIPIDATLAKGGIGAAHIKLGHSNLQGATAYTSFLPVVQVAGHLKIEVVEAE